MKGSFKRGSAGMFRQRAEQFRKRLPEIAQAGAKDAELHAKRGLVINVYGTEPGEHYVRTGLLLREVYASGQANGSSLGILVGDRAEYASDIEYGSGPHALTPQQLERYLNTLKPGGLLRFGRSGQAYLLPGPYIGPAIHYARYRTAERVRALMRELWQ